MKLGNISYHFPHPQSQEMKTLVNVSDYCVLNNEKGT